MNGMDKRTRVCTLLIIANLALIWGNSLIPGELSGRISGFVAELIGKLLGVAPGESQAGHGLLRKIAHFSEFSCLGLLLAWRLSMAGQSGKNLVCQTLLGSLTAACMDETIQIFVDGRGSSLIDVWIDACGAAVGMMILLIGYYLSKKRKQYHILEETT